MSNQEQSQDLVHDSTLNLSYDLNYDSLLEIFNKKTLELLKSDTDIMEMWHETFRMRIFQDIKNNYVHDFEYYWRHSYEFSYPMTAEVIYFSAKWSPLTSFIYVLNYFHKIPNLSDYSPRYEPETYPNYQCLLDASKKNKDTKVFKFVTDLGRFINYDTGQPLAVSDGLLIINDTSDSMLNIASKSFRIQITGVIETIDKLLLLMDPIEDKSEFYSLLNRKIYEQILDSIEKE